ncbi:hypothetical protein TNIN_377581 [Trichonephila inaurata madagascariensis]|uniref:Uncharacterized protein n=1 Tax=Trichonephila inaurata madagascariensis TaxID=2747483 RepID=A0A8X7CEL7_9ARAC|nr:hypothetical protein TNIN_377581 [Trichonephila inaurata madagascariensis]
MQRNRDLTTVVTILTRAVTGYKTIAGFLLREGRSEEDSIGLLTTTSSRARAFFWESPCPERGLADWCPQSKVRLHQSTRENLLRRRDLQKMSPGRCDGSL